MTAGETVLKFTDYPFAYALMAILFNTLNYSISENQILFLGLAGAFGTFLTIIDPVGIVVRARAKGIVLEINKEDTSESYMPLAEYRLSSLKSRAINFEFEKLIGLFYFMIMIFTFMFVVGLTDFVNDIMIKDSEGNPVFSAYELRMIVFWATIIIFGTLSFRAYFHWTDLSEKIEIAGFHQIAINNDNATQTSVENMTRAVEQNDWGLAKIWQKKIQEEIKYKKGKRELIIKSADFVYSPLHKESTLLQNKVDQFHNSHQYPPLPHEEWDKIKQTSRQSIIEDSNLRHRIDSFYNMIYEYNDNIGTVNRFVNDTIYKRMSEIYGKGQVIGIDYAIETPWTSGKVELSECALFGIKPLDYLGENGRIEGITIRFRDKEGRQQNAVFTNNTLFEKAWELVMKDVNDSKIVHRQKNLYEQIKTENSELMKIYSEKIEMQWKV